MLHADNTRQASAGHILKAPVQMCVYIHKHVPIRVHTYTHPYNNCVYIYMYVTYIYIYTHSYIHKLMPTCAVCVYGLACMAELLLIALM